MEPASPPAIGFFCTYTPVEIIHAAGFTPVRIMGGPGPITQADRWLPSFVCPYLRRALESGLTGQYGSLVGLVQGYTCDAACGLVPIWQAHVGGRLVHTIPLPYNQGPSARTFFRAALQELMDKLAGIGAEITNDRLAASITLYSSIRREVNQLYRRRLENPEHWPAGKFYKLILAALIRPPEEVITLLTTEPVPEGISPSISQSATPLLISGSVIDDPEVFQTVENCGGRIVADDLCTGSRAFDMLDSHGDDPLDQLIDYYSRRGPCPARGRAEDRAAIIIDRVRRSGAKGVLFLLQKYCTPHLADIPTLKKLLHEAGVPSQMIELDETGDSRGQMRTRVEGFLEMIN